MTVTFPPGSIWDTGATYLAVPVNTVPGVMGAGMAKEAAKRWMGLKDAHRGWCLAADPRGGDVDIVCGERSAKPRLMFVATKENWREPSRLNWVKRGLAEIRAAMWEAESVALPLLGCGRGGLDPAEVERLIVAEFGDDPERVAEVYR